MTKNRTVLAIILPPFFTHFIYEFWNKGYRRILVHYTTRNLMKK